MKEQNHGYGRKKLNDKTQKIIYGGIEGDANRSTGADRSLQVLQAQLYKINPRYTEGG